MEYKNMNNIENNENVKNRKKGGRIIKLITLFFVILLGFLLVKRLFFTKNERQQANCLLPFSQIILFLFVFFNHAVNIIDVIIPRKRIEDCRT